MGRFFLSPIFLLVEGEFGSWLIDDDGIVFCFLLF